MGNWHRSARIIDGNKIADCDIDQIQHVCLTLLKHRGRPAIAVVRARFTFTIRRSQVVRAMTNGDAIGAKIIRAVVSRKPMRMIFHRALRPGHGYAFQCCVWRDEEHSLLRTLCCESDAQAE